jgi:hypothetical protein
MGRPRSFRHTGVSQQVSQERPLAGRERRDQGRLLVDAPIQTSPHLRSILGERKQLDSPVAGERTALDQPALLEAIDEAGHIRRVTPDTLRQLPHGDRRRQVEQGIRLRRAKIPLGGARIEVTPQPGDHGGQ